jgi:hypothetical protein
MVRERIPFAGFLRAAATLTIRVGRRGDRFAPAYGQPLTTARFPASNYQTSFLWVGAFARPRFMCEVVWRGPWVGLPAGRSSVR